MFIANNTDYDYNDSLSINNNCTDKENKNDINIPALLFTIPCKLSFLCLMSSMVYTIFKPFFH